MTSEADLRKARAEDRFTRAVQRKEDATAANTDHLAEVARVDANTLRLRGLRLAKEAEDRQIAEAVPAKRRKKPTKSGSTT